MVPDLRPPLRDSQQEEPVCLCDGCLGEVYREETLYEWQGRWVCVDCFLGEMGRWLSHTPEQAARTLGFACRSSME